MGEWKPALGWAWEYEVPPYRGVLISLYVGKDHCQSRYAASILAPQERHCAPALFTVMADAQAWIEQEIERLTLQERAVGDG